MFGLRNSRRLSDMLLDGHRLKEKTVHTLRPHKENSLPTRTCLKAALSRLSLGPLWERDGTDSDVPAFFTSQQTPPRVVNWHGLKYNSAFDKLTNTEVFPSRVHMCGLHTRQKLP